MKSTAFLKSAAPVNTVNTAATTFLASTKSDVDASCNTTITMDCVKQLYNISSFVPSASGNSIGVTGYLEEYANEADLASFFADQVPEAVNSTFNFVSVNGGINSQNLSDAGFEADLDTQIAFGITYPIPATFYSTAGRPPIVIPPGQNASDVENDNEPYVDVCPFLLLYC